MNIKEFPKKIAENVILYSPDPILYLVKAFISKEECQAFIKQFDNQLGTDSIKNSRSKKSILDNNTNHCFIDHNVDEIDAMTQGFEQTGKDNKDKFLAAVRQELSDIISFFKENFVSGENVFWSFQNYVTKKFNPTKLRVPEADED